MPLSFPRLLSFLAVTLLGLPAFGQLTGSSLDSHVVVSESNSKNAPVAHHPIRHQSYTVELKTTTVQTLSDGTTITRESTEIRASDSQRRTLFSTTQKTPFGDQQKTITTVHVNDPVESTQTDWSSQSKVARVLKLPTQDQQHGCWQSESGNMHIDYGVGHPVSSGRVSIGNASGGIGGGAGFSTTLPSSMPRPIHEPPTSEDLGTTTIQGLEAHGHRFTTVVPAGQIGNDKPLMRVNESWMASGLGFPLRSVNDDPQSGKSTTEVVNLDLSEPPLSAFLPPDDYKVVVEELHQVTCPEPGMPWQ